MEVAQQIVTNSKCASPLESVPWDRIARFVPGRWLNLGSHLHCDFEFFLVRSGLACRERWYNVLDPFLKRDPFTAEEDRLAMELTRILPKRQWAKISQYIEGRTDSNVARRVITLTGPQWNSNLHIFNFQLKFFFPELIIENRSERKVRAVAKRLIPLQYARRFRFKELIVSTTQI